MLFNYPHPPDAQYAGVDYQFLEPVRFRIRKPDGTITLIGYGIGEKIAVLEPTCEYLVTACSRRKEIALADGSWIIDPPKSVNARRVYV